MNDADCLESIRAYHATTSFMDAQVGRVVDELERLGLSDNTVVVFMSDHGYLLGQHQAWQKMMLFEEACRVPFIVSYPGMKQRGVATKAITESVDLYPTVAELCGLKGPKELQGTSAVSVLEDPSRPGTEAAFTQVSRGNGAGHSIRTDRWRYTEWGPQGANGIELYDHEKDPQEYINVAKDAAHGEVLKQLRAKLRAAYPSTQPVVSAL
jgi:iduronate 2-sulfatase